MSKAIPWSYSMLTGYETCPFQHFSVKVAKTTPSKPYVQSSEGIERHKAIEKYLRFGAPLPDTVPKKLVDATMSSFNPDLLQVEAEYAITAEHKSCGFWANNCYARGKLDVVYVDKEDTIGHVVDWKSGKVREDSKQLDMAAVLVMGRYPHIQEVKTSFVWFKYDQITPGSVRREDIPLVWQPFVKRVEAMQESYINGHWPKRPSGLCREYCPVTTCEHNGAHRNGNEQ